MNGVAVTFPNGQMDQLVLERHYTNEGDRIARIEHCRFIGHLANEPEASIAMTGCIGIEDVEFTILSKHATESSLFKWYRNGSVDAMEHQFEVHFQFS